MMVPCPNCDRLVEQASVPIRGMANDGSDLWVCIKCPAVVCSHPIVSGDSSEPCYSKHTREAHSTVYEPKKRPTEGGKKNSRDKKR